MTLLPFHPNLSIEYEWQNLIKLHSIKNIKWTLYEDVTLKSIKEMNMTKKWINISQEMAKQLESFEKTPKKCRERWNNYLDPNVNKMNWSFSEIKELFKQVQIFGKRWANISKFLKGRTENAVKNQFNSLMNKYGTVKSEFNHENEDQKQDSIQQITKKERENIEIILKEMSKLEKKNIDTLNQDPQSQSENNKEDLEKKNYLQQQQQFLEDEYIQNIKKQKKITQFIKKIEKLKNQQKTEIHFQYMNKINNNDHNNQKQNGNSINTTNFDTKTTLLQALDNNPQINQTQSKQENETISTLSVKQESNYHNNSQQNES